MKGTVMVTAPRSGSTKAGLLRKRLMTLKM